MLPKSATSSAQAEQQNMDGQRAVRHIYFMFFSQFPPLMEFRSRLVTAQVQAACRPFFCKNKIGNSWLTNAAFHGILIDVDGALAQLVAHNTGSVGVRSSNLLCSTIPKKSEHHPDWGWVRISSFYLKYCGVNSKMNERRRIGIIPIVPALKNNDRARTYIHRM